MTNPFDAAVSLVQEQLADLPPHRLVGVRLVATVEYMNGQRTEVGADLRTESGAGSVPSGIVQVMAPTQTVN